MSFPEYERKKWKWFPMKTPVILEENFAVAVILASLSPLESQNSLEFLYHMSTTELGDCCYSNMLSETVIPVCYGTVNAALYCMRLLLLQCTEWKCCCSVLYATVIDAVYRNYMRLLLLQCTEWKCCCCSIKYATVIAAVYSMRLLLLRCTV
jgi:hypothetical protein